jgi:hypothetical protein
MLFRRIQRLLTKQATLRKFLIFFIVTHIIYVIMLLYSIPLVSDYAGGMKILDIMPTGYTAEYARTLFDTLGEQGRNAYLFKQIPLDLIYPFMFGVTFALLLILIFRKTFDQTSKVHFLFFLPLIAAFFDYLENAGTILMLLTYPTFSDVMASANSLFTVTKSVFSALTFIMIIVGLVFFFSRTTGEGRFIWKAS